MDPQCATFTVNSSILSSFFQPTPTHDSPIMFAKSTGTRGRRSAAEGESSQPLLAPEADAEGRTTIFAVDSDDDNDALEDSALRRAPDTRLEHTVRFQENVQVIGPPLKSTNSSREAGVYVSSLAFLDSRSDFCSLEFDLDSDEFDESSVNELDDVEVPTTPRGHTDQTMPLLVGLFDSSSSRIGSENVPLHSANGGGFSTESDLDLEELVSKQHAGGGMLDSVANMANSILGAGKSSMKYSYGRGLTCVFIQALSVPHYLLT